MATKIRVGSKATPSRSTSQNDSDEDDYPRRRRRSTRTDDEESPSEPPKRKTSTTISLGSKPKKEEEEKADNKQESPQRERRRKVSATSITLGNKGQPAKSVDEDSDYRIPDQEKKSTEKEEDKKDQPPTKPAMTNGDIGKANDLSYDETYQKAKEMYGEPEPVNTKIMPRKPRVKNKSESWPPKETEDNEMFTVEGYGLTDPYNKTMIDKKQTAPEHAQQTPYRDTTHYDPRMHKKKPEEPRYTNPALPHDERVEIVDDHVRPVAQLKRQWQYKPQPKIPGVNRPANIVKDEDSWIKHVKAPIEYDKAPEEPQWKQLVRNRRWRSTVRARFPSQDAEVIEFERRSTTPKNWSRLLKDKKSVRMIGAITGIGPEGEELLWRLASRRDKIESTSPVDDHYRPREPSDTLAYEHMKDNLEAAVYACLDGRERDYTDYEGSDVASIAETIPSIQSTRGKLSRSSSIASDSGSPKLRRRPPRLAPEDFKKQIALEKSRDATLRWQFSADPYDSVHENQLLPFEMAVLYGEKDRRLRNLLRKLVKPEDLPDSAFSSPPGTPRRRGGYYDSEPELDCMGEGDYYGSREGLQQSRGSRPKKRVPPPPPPRRGRSASPSLRRRMPDSDYRFSPSDLVLSDDLKDEIKKLDLLSQQIQDDDSEHMPAVHDTKARIEAGAMDEAGTRYEKDVPEETIRTGIEDRKKSFLKEAGKQRTEDDLKAQRTADINKREVRARRDRFVEQDRQSQDETEPERPQKPRRKAQRIKSDAELHELFRKRREAADAEPEGDQQNEASGEMKKIVSDIQETFGGEDESR